MKKQLLATVSAAALLFVAHDAYAVTTNLCSTVTALGAATSHNFVTTLGTNCTFSIAQPAVTDLANIAAGTVVANPTGSSATPSATTAPVLGIGGSSTGSVGLSSSGGGAVTISGGTATITPYTIVPPVAAPVSDGQVWASTTGGVGSWVSIASAARNISSQTGTTFSATTAQDGYMYDNLGNTGTTTATLSTTAGDNWCFAVVAAHPVIITAGAGATIDNGGAVSATAGNMQSTTIGSVACVYIESATVALVYAATGPWAIT
jgi:hypothetical protein